MSTVSFPKRTLLAASFIALAGLSATPAFAAKDVVVAVYSNFTTLDPYDANDTLSQAISKSFYQGLFGFDKDAKLINVLAESYTASDDGLTYTFKLRQGVKFHDGTDFNADAVKATFDRVTNPDNHLKRYNMFKRITKTEVIDPYTVKITLDAPYSAFINSLAHPSAVMISPAALKKYGKEIAFHPVGTGPFQFDEWNATDYMKVKKFDGYWKQGLPKVDSITWRPVVENNTRAAMMQTGEAHFAYTIPYEQAKLLEKNDKLVMVSSPSIIQRYVSFNVLQKPFDNVKVRQALNYAINKQALAKVAFSGYATPAEGVVPKGVDFAVSYGAWPYDPAKAKELLKEAGYPDGFSTVLWANGNNTTAQKVIQFVQQQLGQVGVKVQIEAMEAGQRVAKVESIPTPDKAGVRMYYAGWSSSTMESDFALTPLLATASWPPKMFNTAYYSNEKVDKGLVEALKTTNRDEKAKLYKEIQDQIWADAPWIFLTTDQLLYVHSKDLSGMYITLDGSFNFDNVDLKQ
ncbi:glutathione ABC transporter substrate-binding protein GsiB [Leminorella grimontii]|uniref:glutathione ABC transporter substrate-binding protein GsiB n=1 Tax=Leminorella grimontii TaxID=82981 RepID=UPI0020867D89|nr:glutathione ABC transporter substrate-binding protein GsiB [Leminorella grimontii]GKX58411.1 glutathione ABC transporter substrate-binding protein GsiB [Leminorella grimontii]